MEKSVRSTSEPTDKVIDSRGMPLKLDLQIPQSADLTPTLSNVDSNSSEPNPQKSYQIPKTLRLHSWSWPELQNFKELQTKQLIDSDRMSFDLTNHVAEMMEVICEANQQGKEFLRMTPKPENRETRCVEKSPRPCPQVLGPAVVSSERRSQRGQSVVLLPKPFCHIPDSASGITPGRGSPIPESINVPSKSWLQIEESLALSTEQTSWVEENGDSLELTFETWQPRGVAARLTKSQNMSMENTGIIPVESLDQIIDFVRISPKPLDQVIEFAKTELQAPRSVVLPKVSESLKVIPGPPLQVIKSVTIPQSTSQVSKYDDLTLRMHDVINSEYAPSLWLQNVQSKKLITEPTHHILETIELSGFQVIRTVLIPKPLLLIVKSEELAPVPCPQVTEPIGDTTRSSIEVKECLNLLPRPHLQDLVKPLELTLTANIEVNSAELILQQTSPIEEPTVLTPEQRLQAQKSLGLKTESPNVIKIEDLNQGWVCQNRDSEMITSEELQAENYFSRFVDSPSIPFTSSSVKTTELGHLQGSGVPEVSRTLAIKNLDVDLLPPAESHSGIVMLQSSALPLVLCNQPSNESENNMEKPYPEIWEMDLITKEEAEKKHVEELGNSLQNYSPYPLRLLPEELQAGFGARRSSIRSFLGRQQNVWESHVCRQRLPRKYLSNMLMLGNVLGTTMERKLCSQPFLTEGSTMDICQSIQNLFGVPAELMEFSQSPLDRGPRTISQTSVVKNYIQRHILCHSHEKRMPLKMWTRGSTSSIIQQYSGTRLGIKKTNSKLNVIVQETTQDVAVTRKGPQFLALVNPDSTLGVLYSREDAASREQSKILQNDSPTRTVESHHSLKASSLSQAKTDTSEQLQLLKDLQLKIAAKLLRSQIPHNVPPPLASGLVLKYPICLQCGRCSGFNCCHKFQSALGPYLLIYPQLHLLSTPEGHGEIRLHLGFRLRTGKRPPVSKHSGRNRADPRKSATSPSRRKAKIHTSASKSPTSRRDFQSRSTQSPASLQAHIRQKQWISQGVVGKTEAKDYEFCHVHSASESGFESNQDEKWAKSSFRKTSDLKYSAKKITKGPKTRNTKLYCNSRITEESPSGTLTDPSRSKSTTTIQTSTSSSKRQSKRSSQPKFIQLLFQGLRQIFQAAHRIVTVSGQKPEDRTRPHNLYSSKNLYPKQKAKDCCLTEDSKRASPPVVKHGATGLIPKEEDKFQGTRDLCRQAQQPKQKSSLQPRPLQFRKTMVSERDVCIQATSVIQPLSHVPNVNGRAKKNRSDEISSPESKNCSKEEAKFEIQERIISDSLMKRTLKSHFKENHTHKEEQHGSFREEALRKKPSERTHLSASERTHRSVSERRYYSPSQKKHSGPSDRSHCNSSQRKGRSSSTPPVCSNPPPRTASRAPCCDGGGVSMEAEAESSRDSLSAAAPSEAARRK
ncbi:uncharacterized protein C2orf16-like [Psammomys obesus]|uniref:uncharacterized protein C2orf16-like n=1 Tax=Psammomys obesus TaxID=48139 RepID=UPI0024528586|nr:uncharacterized protein C2orf16-like [Psammomys obesus]